MAEHGIRPNRCRSGSRRHAAICGRRARRLNNPLGAGAMYIYRDGVDAIYRLHGTRRYWSIGQAVWWGRVRLNPPEHGSLLARMQWGRRSWCGAQPGARAGGARRGAASARRARKAAKAAMSSGRDTRYPCTKSTRPPARGAARPRPIFDALDNRDAPERLIVQGACQQLGGEQIVGRHGELTESSLTPSSGSTARFWMFE